MSDILIGAQTQAEAVFCPQCQSPVEVPVSLLSRPMDVACTACGWKGVHTQLAVVPFKHEFKSDEQIAEEMARDLRNILSKTAAVTYGSFLLKWGFLDQPISAYQFARYLEGIAKSAVVSITETRRFLIEEKTRDTAQRPGIPRAPGGKDG